MNYTALWRQLAAVYDEGEARAIARYMLEEKYGMGTTDIYCGRELPDDDSMNDDVERLMRKEPVQYVVGWTHFCGHKFAVGNGVLIPRPETEELVEHIIANGHNSPAILDIGTGSGCIAVSLALGIASAEVTAWDISREALHIAEGNAEALGAKVRFECQNALDAPDDTGKWDAIVSNPPYICNKERATMHGNVLDYEPHTALFVPDDDPLLFYRAITRYAGKALKPNGRIYFEINPIYAGMMVEMAKKEGFDAIRIIEDSFGKRRFAEIGGGSPKSLSPLTLCHDFRHGLHGFHR